MLYDYDVDMTQPVRTLKDVGVAYLFAVLLGGFAAHRLYLGYIGTAFGFMGLWFGGLLLMNYGGLLAVVAAVIWWIVDLVRLPRLTRHANVRIAAS